PGRRAATRPSWAPGWPGAPAWRRCTTCTCGRSAPVTRRCRRTCWSTAGATATPSAATCRNCSGSRTGSPTRPWRSTTWASRPATATTTATTRTAPARARGPRPLRPRSSSRPRRAAVTRAMGDGGPTRVRRRAAVSRPSAGRAGDGRRAGGRAAGLEPEGRRSAFGDGAVVARVHGVDVRAALRDGGVPAVHDLLALRERPVGGPAGERLVPGVGDGHGGGEPAVPGVVGSQGRRALLAAVTRRGRGAVHLDGE